MNTPNPAPSKPANIIPIVLAISISQSVTSAMPGQPIWLRVIVAGVTAGAVVALAMGLTRLFRRG